MHKQQYTVVDISKFTSSTRKGKSSVEHAFFPQPPNFISPTLFYYNSKFFQPNISNIFANIPPTQFY